MKRPLSTFLFLMIGLTATAQPWQNLLNPIDPTDPDVPAYRRMMEDPTISWYEVELAYKKYWAAQNRMPSEEEGGSEFHRYLAFIKNNSDEKGFYRPTKRGKDFWQTIQATRQSNARNAAMANWTVIGPEITDDTEENNTRMHSIYQDANGHLWAGAGTAGLWKSPDNGSTWTNLTHTLPEATNMDGVRPDRTDANHILVGSRDNGLFRTVDGGAIWVKATEFDKARKIVQHPTIDTVWYAGANDGFYQSIDNGDSWTALFSGGFIWDFELHPTHSDTIYILEESSDGNGQNQRIYKTTDGGDTFTQLTMGLPADADADMKRAEMAVTPAAPDNLYVVFAGDDGNSQGLYGVYISTDVGVSFSLKCCGGSPGGNPYSASNPNILGYGEGTEDGGQLNFQQSLAVSPTDANHLFSGGVYIWQSTNMGATWTKIPDDTYHADNHDILVTDTKIYTATDGGILVASHDDYIFSGITNGIYGSEFWTDFGFSRKNGEVMVGGTLHNGTLGKFGNNFGQWTQFHGGDLPNGYVDMAQNLYSVRPNSSGNGIRRSKDEGNSFTLLSTASRYIATHPHTTSVLYAPDVGLYNLWRSLDDGATWSKLTDFSTTTSVGIEDIQICETAPNNMALNLKDDRSIAVTSNGGATWTIRNIPTHSRKVNDLIMSHTDPLTMWIVFEKNDVYKTIDGGLNWIVYNQGILQGINLECITHHVGSNDAVYLGGENMVYYRDNSMSSWESFSTGLPTFIDVNDIEVIYAINKIRISTNRSVWESDLNSVAAPFAAIAANVTEIADCDNLQVQFYDASFVPDAGTTWNWTFTGGTPATSTEQNPTITYQSMGSYAVSLEISNGGNYSTRIIDQLIVVNDIPTTALPISEDIENFTFSGFPPCNPAHTLSGSLHNATDDDFAADSGDWQVNDGPGRITYTSPSTDYTEGTETGKYLYLRGSFGCPTEETAAILTDCFDFNNLNEPTLFFAYHAYNANDAPNPSLHVDVQSNGNWTTDVLVVNGEQGPDWQTFEVDLSAFKNTIVKLRIWGTTSTNGEQCDLALDGIQIYDAAPCQALLDLSGSESGNPVSQQAEKIESSQTVETGAKVTYDAKDFVLLKEGFSVAANADFHAFIQGCTAPALQESPSAAARNEPGQKFSTIEEQPSQLTVKVYPNPINKHQLLTVESDSTLPLQFQLFALTGQEISSQLINGSQSVELPNLPSGIYFYKIENETIGQIGQLVVQ